MNRKWFVSAVTFLMALGLSACGQPKTEDIIKEAFTEETVAGFSSRDLVDSLKTASTNGSVKGETIVSFSYDQEGISFAGDTGVSYEFTVKNSPEGDGSDTFIDGRVSLILPESLSMLTGFTKKTLPVQMYSHLAGDNAKLYFNQGLFDGRESIWTVSDASLSDICSLITQDLEAPGASSKAEDLEFIQNTLISHSTRQKKPILHNEHEVYAFDMVLPLSDPDVMDWILNKADSVIPATEEASDKENLRVAIGQICQLATIHYTYYINVEDNRLSYSKLDYSDIDLNGVLRVIGSTLPEGTLDKLGGLDLKLKSAFFEKTEYPPEELSIPNEILSTPYTYETYNAEFGKGEIVSMIDPDPEPEPEPVEVRVFKWKSDWSDMEYPELGTLGEYGHTDYSDMNLNTFLDDGWSIAGNEEEFDFLPMYNEFYPDTFLYLYDENSAGKAEGLEKKVVGYDIDISYASEDSDIPQMNWKGVTWGASPEKLIKAYGDEGIREESDEYTYLTYSYDVADIEFSFYTGEDESLRKGLYEVIVKYNHVPAPEYEYIYLEAQE